MVILPWPSALRSEIRLLLISFFFSIFCVFPSPRHIPTVFPSNRLLVLALLCAEFGHNPCCLLPLKEVSAFAQPTLAARQYPSERSRNCVESQLEGVRGGSGGRQRWSSTEFALSRPMTRLFFFPFHRCPFSHHTFTSSSLLLNQV